jgi:hypothetical protein
MCIIMHCKELKGDNPESFNVLVHRSSAEDKRRNEKLGIAGTAAKIRSRRHPNIYTQRHHYVNSQSSDREKHRKRGGGVCS